MDAAHLTQVFVVTGAALAVGRFVVTTFGRAEVGLEVLFVPPDRGMGWPHGVQEGDDPWGWQPPAVTSPEVLDAAGTGPDPDGPAASLPDLPTGAGRFVVEPTAVAPITFRARPH